MTRGMDVLQNGHEERKLSDLENKSGWKIIRIRPKSEGNSKKWKYIESSMMVLVLSSGKQ